MNRVKDVGSIFGKPLRTSYDYMKLLNKEYKEYKVLVIDDKDELYSIAFLNHGANRVVMYEPDERFIKGGVIDNYKLLGINKRKNYINDKDKLKIINKNFYEEKVEETF